MRKILTALFVALVAAAPASAQDYHPVGFNFGFGWAFPVMDFKKTFDAGWNGTIGATFYFTEHVGLQAEYIYSRMEGPSRQILVSATPVLAATTNGLIESNHQMHVGSFNLVYRGQSANHPIGGYALGGGGVYHRIIQLTSPSVGYTTVCDPYWLACYATPVSVDQIIGDRSSTDFGIDFGGGVTFGHEAKFYVESRFHYVWGPTITAPTVAGSTLNCSSGCTSNASYFPLTFGMRW